MIKTTPRQVKLITCRAYTPGLENRGGNATGIDISDYINEIDIYESVWDDTLSGSITLTDIAALPEYIPLVGIEYLFLKFSIDIGEEEGPKEFERMFQIVGLRNQQFIRNEQRMYTLDIVTPEYLQSI